MKKQQRLGRYCGVWKDNKLIKGCNKRFVPKTKYSKICDKCCKKSMKKRWKK